MRNRIVIGTAILICIFACGMMGSVAWGQSSSTPAPSAPATGAPPSGQQSMPGMDMSGSSGHNMSNMQMNGGQMNGQMKDMPMGTDSDKADDDTGAHAMKSMEGHMDMGPHMKMTALRPAKTGDAARAQQVVEEARKVAEKYVDYHTALDDGFKIFLPRVPQKVYHFTNGSYAREAELRFNPGHPTSLLYEKHGDDYKLIGVMYTAPKRYTEDQLDERIPLSVAQWHEHVNFCIPPLGRWRELRSPNPQFGLRGSIATQEACDAAGGTFRPVVFNWMVHVYPFEKDTAKAWSVERQHGDAD
jgi:hypothetical protein